MDVQGSISFLNQCMDRHRQATRWYTMLSVGIFLLGIGIALLTAFTQQDTKIQWLTTLGSGFVSSLSGFPLKELVANRNRTASLSFLQTELIRMGASVAPDAELLEALEKRIWALVDKNL